MWTAFIHSSSCCGLLYMYSPASSCKWQQDAMLTRLLAGAASCTIEVCDRGPKDIGDISLRPLPRFAHCAVVVPSSFCGKHSMVRLPTYIHACLCMGSSWEPCISSSCDSTACTAVMTVHFEYKSIGSTYKCCDQQADMMQPYLGGSNCKCRRLGNESCLDAAGGGDLRRRQP